MAISSKDSEKKAFKDWFDHAAAKALGKQVAAVAPNFDQRTFVRKATKGVEALEFATRVGQFSDALAATLPDSVPEALATLVRSLPPPLTDCKSISEGWLLWPVGQFIADHGTPHFSASMDAMTELTQRFSAEFAIRPFVEQYPKKTFAYLMKRTAHPNPHVRRWCSEGVRPRLPWGKKLRALVADPTPIWPVLEALKDDPELYVRRSVANNLNDIAKDHPDAVIERCRNWLKEKHTPERAWIVRHGLRSLIKAGHPLALATIGFAPPEAITAALHATPSTVTTGGSSTLTAEIRTTHPHPQKIAVDYAVHYVRKGGKTGVKVFKWKTAELPAQGHLTLQKKHPFKITTIRALYPGAHQIELQINGSRICSTSIDLAVPDAP